MAKALSSVLKPKNALNPALFYRNRQLESKKLYNSIVERLAKLTPYTERELRLIFRRAGIESMKTDAEMVRAVGMKVPELVESEALTGAVNAVFGRTNAVLNNLTRSIAYQSEMQFIAAADDAFLAVSTGTLGIDQAVRQGVLNLVEQGIRTVTNPMNGHTDQADVAIKRNIWTAVNQTTGDMTLAMAAEVGTDYVEVSAHPGARNKGVGPANHESWQGKVYSISGKDSKYESLIPITGYGTGPGLLGWNCRHSLFLAFPGFEQPVYTQAELNRINNTTVTYNGQQMDLYSANQHQRYLERGVRGWKRKANALDSVGLDSTPERAKIAEWQKRARDFTKQTGLERRREWEQVAGFKVKKPVVAMPQSVDELKIFGKDLKIFGKPKAKPKPAAPKKPTSKPTTPKPATPKPKPVTPKPVTPKPAKPITPKPKTAKSNEFVPAKTIKEANEYAVRELGLQGANYKGVPVEFANEWNKSLKYYKDNYPEVIKQMKYTGTSTGIREIQMPYYKAQAIDRYKAYFNRMPTEEEVLRYARKSVTKAPKGCWAYADPEAQWKGVYMVPSNLKGVNISDLASKSVAVGYHPIGCESLKSILDHEIGHQFDYLLGVRTNGELMKALNHFSISDIASNLSGYAAKKSYPVEVISEAWAEYMNNPSIRPIAKEISDIIKKLYKDAFGGK